MNLFAYHNYPSLPEKFVKQIFNIVDTTSIHCGAFLDEVDNINWSTNLGMPLLRAPKNTAAFHTFEANNEINNWVKENIPEKIKKIHIYLVENGTQLFPHIDEIRTHAFNYLIDTGGSNVITSFYKVKKKYQHLHATSRTYIPRNRLNLVEKVIIEKNLWHSLSVQNIHDVRNIEIGKRRIILSLSA